MTTSEDALDRQTEIERIATAAACPRRQAAPATRPDAPSVGPGASQSVDYLVGEHLVDVQKFSQ
jgi:hypothetical protein